MNVSGRLISLRRRSVLRLWYICGLVWSKTIFWKISQKSEPSADFTRFGHFHFFTFFHFDRSMCICSMGPGDFIAYVNPK